MVKKKAKVEKAFVGAYSGMVLSYQCMIGAMSAPKHTWATISLKIDNKDLPVVHLDFELNSEPNSYIQESVVHLLQPLKLYEQTLKLLQAHEKVTVNFYIEDDGDTIDIFSLSTPLKKMKKTKGKKV